MLRCLSFCAVVVVLACPPSVEAQTVKPQSFTQRLKSLFTRNEKPKPAPAPRSMKPAAKPAEKPPAKPVQVTTRSGALRQPGPENHAPLQSEPTPTFAPADVPLAGLPPRELDAPAARRLPAQPAATKKAPRRDPGVSQASYEETQPKKTTMASWFRGLWGRKKKAEPAAPASPPRSMNRSRQPMGSSTSIDPRRVYRGPEPESSEQNRAGSTREFSETGVPSSTSEFRGRRDSSF